MFKKSPLKSSKLVRRKRRIRFLKIAGIIIVVIAFIAGLSYVSRLPAITISTIEVKGNSAVDESDIKKIIEKDTAGNYLYLFSRANMLLYPKRDIISHVMLSFKRIESLDIKVSNFNTLVVTVTERKPAYVWCKGTPADKGNKGCYLIDVSGYVFDDAPVFSGNAFFAFYGPLSSKEPIGASYLNEEKFRNIDKLITWLDQQELSSHALYAKDNDVFELILNNNSKIIFKDIKNSNEFELLQSTIQTILNSTNIFSKAASTTLEYVDLRFGNKVYYKFIGDNSVQVEN